MGIRKTLYTINGVERLILSDPEEEMSNFLRRIGLTSVKVGCGVGQCGACTVLLDGEPVRSCTKKMKNVPEFSKIETVEGLGTATSLHPLQLGFMIHNGAQCGFCTPGLILSAKELLDENPTPTEADVKEALSGVICRCTGYVKPIASVLKAAAELRQTKPA